MRQCSNRCGFAFYPKQVVYFIVAAVHYYHYQFAAPAYTRLTIYHHQRFRAPIRLGSQHGANTTRQLGVLHRAAKHIARARNKDAPVRKRRVSPESVTTGTPRLSGSVNESTVLQ